MVENSHRERVRESIKRNASILQGLDTNAPTAVFAQRKTGRSVAIALSTPAVTAIRDAMRVTASPYVFASPTGQPVRPGAITASVRRRAAYELADRYAEEMDG